MNLELLTKWEPVWLFLLLALELWFSIAIWRMAKIEFEYDKEWNERKAARRKEYGKKAKGLDTAPVSSSSGKKDLAVEPGQNFSLKESKTFNAAMEVRDLQQISDENRLRDEEGKKTPKD